MWVELGGFCGARRASWGGRQHLQGCWLHPFCPLGGGKHLPQRYWVSGARAASRPRQLRPQSLGSPPRPEWTVRPLPSRRPGLARYRLRRRDGPAAGTREGQAGGGRWVRPVAGGLTAGRHRNGPRGRSSAQPRFFSQVNYLKVSRDCFVVFLLISEYWGTHSLSVSFLYCFAFLKSPLQLNANS